MLALLSLQNTESRSVLKGKMEGRGRDAQDVPGTRRNKKNSVCGKVGFLWSTVVPHCGSFCLQLFENK